MKDQLNREDRQGVRVVMDEYEYKYDWFTGNIPVWREHLAKYKGRNNLTFIEIGSWEGRSAAWLLEHVVTGGSSMLHCIDPWSGSLGAVIERRFDHNTRIAMRTSQAQCIKHHSRSVDVLPRFDRESVDMIYVDGSHVPRDVLSDLVLSWPLLKVGGLLICDDYELEHETEFCDEVATYHLVPPAQRPKVAIDSFLRCFRDCYRVQHQAWQVLVEKVRP